ncbi:hypothetical protein AB0D49_31770 [Streptomyces sp. NPDC048290]|uniref:hypothetical protein n=1 Tax=Streptomyces sp. NPDC048290 TaxID=3155811 RepID=UPI003449B78D
MGPARTLPAGVLTAVPLTGCGGSDDKGGGAPRDTGASPTAGVPWATAAATPAAQAPARSAAGGHDIAACADADCDVRVPAPVGMGFPGPAGHTDLAATEVGPDTVASTLTWPRGRSHSAVNGTGQGCLTVLRPGGSDTSCARLPGPPPAPEPGMTGPDGTALLHPRTG